MFLSRVAVLLLLLESCVQVWSQPTCQDVVGQSRAPNGKVQGTVNINTNGAFAQVFLELKMAVANYNPSVGFGSIQVDGGKTKLDDIARQAAQSNPQVLPFIITYPPINEVPLVTKITVNGQAFCMTPQPSDGIQGNIALNYLLQTGMPQKHTSGLASFSHAPQDVLEAKVGFHRQVSRPVTTSRPRYTQKITTKPSSSDKIYFENHKSRPFYRPDSNRPSPSSTSAGDVDTTSSMADVDTSVLDLAMSISDGETEHSDRLTNIIEQLIVKAEDSNDLNKKRLQLESLRLQLELRARGVGN